MRLLFVDIVEPGWSDYQEGRLIARSLRFKLKWDMLYDATPEMSRFQGDARGEFGKTGVGYEVTFQRAQRLLKQVRSAKARNTKELTKLIQTATPSVLFLCAHGFVERGQTTLGGHTSSTRIPLDRLARMLKQTDLSSTCVVSSACELGKETAIKHLKKVGFGSGIGWPGCTCMTETLSFSMDLFEALAFQYVLASKPDDEEAPPPYWIKRAFAFARTNLESRYRNCNNVFGKSMNTKNSAGYYLHTRPWNREYTDRPVMWT